jgi:hypothetical protein
MKRLTGPEVAAVRRIVEAHLATLNDRLHRARMKREVDPAEVAFYEDHVSRTSETLALLPASGRRLELDDISDEQRDEDEDEVD